MKSNFWLLQIFMITCVITLYSCSDKRDCSVVDYHEVIEVHHGDTYCFPDGAQLEILAIQNHFCPCFMQCIWEGEIILEVSWTSPDGHETRGKVGTHKEHGADLDIGTEMVNIVREPMWDVEFVHECSEVIPSPEIISASVFITI